MMNGSRTSAKSILATNEHQVFPSPRLFPAPGFQNLSLSMSLWTFCGLVVTFACWLAYKMVTFHRPPEPKPRAVMRIVLVGDSILDNRPYAGTRGSTPQILATLAPHVTVETVARDGDVIAHIDEQMQLLEADMDALAVVSVGGNDCLGLLNSVDMACVGYDDSRISYHYDCRKLLGLLWPGRGQLHCGRTATAMSVRSVLCRPSTGRWWRATVALGIHFSPHNGLHF